MYISQHYFRYLGLVVGAGLCGTTCNVFPVIAICISRPDIVAQTSRHSVKCSPARADHTYGYAQLVVVGMCNLEPAWPSPGTFGPYTAAATDWEKTRTANLRSLVRASIWSRSYIEVWFETLH